ncbi:PREDICTED: PXMP2/4 family protein 4-like [Fragaria vesca subsp. vesca]|uniref:PXMP2/4 family protein 4-like n=1 Tax=Fragaria vesca subsp. vesca TaxID=101020 RepID=UPI0002C314B0|nr:PREDICTED: PXMP2/4 family protein 4-like [Fragaria vesca subsp. vesca]
MSGALRRNTTLTRLLHNHTRHRPIPTSPAAQFQTKAYLRAPNVFRKAKDNYSLLSSSAFFSAKPSSSSSAASSSTGLVAWYLGLVKNRPVLTKSITAALIYTAADLSSQTIAKSDSYDPVRTLRMAAYGMVILGPSLHFWFNFMAKTFPKRDMLSTLKKMAMGQGVYGPTMTVVFFSVNAFLQGENGGEVFDRLKRDLVPTLLSGVMYWPMCDFITFRFIPVHLQTLVSNGFSYLWTIYLTYMASLEKASAVAID